MEVVLLGGDVPGGPWGPNATFSIESKVILRRFPSVGPPPLFPPAAQRWFE
jgi:hypothetical protein